MVGFEVVKAFEMLSWNKTEGSFEINAVVKHKIGMKKVSIMFVSTV